MDFHPDAVGRAPGRVNLIGEHTDYNAGLCLPLALSRSASAAVAPLPDGSLQVRSRSFPDPWQGTIEELEPGAVPGWAGYVTGVLWALRQGGLDVPGLDVLIDSDVPIGAGLSSSAALECAVAVAVAGLLDLPLNALVRTRLARACVRAETEYVGAPTGGMDQTVAMLATAGSALLIDFDDDTTSDVPLPLAEAGLTLVVTDTGVSHAHATGG
ncbi:MAG: galactokinase, partial [Nocardioides sp.]